jgi:hypothetical protein
MISMFSYERKNLRSRGGRVWSLLPAAALGALVALLPSESQAAPTCTTKPAICDRMAAAQKQSQSQPLIVRELPRAAVARSTTPSPTCATKPAVCARLDVRSTPAAAAPVTLANSAAGPRCASKPAVCARLRVRPTAAPFTLATTAADVR